MASKFSARVILTLLLMMVLATGIFAWSAVDAVTGTDITEREWVLVPIAEREIAFRVPADWTEQAPEIAYTDMESALTLGLDHGIVIPDVHTPSLLPDELASIETGPVDLGWSQGTRTVLENASGAQIRIVVQVDENVYGFYLSGKSLAQVESHEALLVYMIDSVILAENNAAGLAVFNK